MMVSTTGRRVTVVKSDRPCPCVQAGGINGGNTSQYYVEQHESVSRMKVYHENGGFKRTECLNIPSPTITAMQCRMIVEQGTGNRKQGTGNLT